MELEGLGYPDLVRLKNSRIALVGLTGIGITALLAIISTGVSNIKLVDINTVNEQLLPQGTFFSKRDIGKPKTIAVKEKLVELRLIDNIAISNVELRESNIATVLADYDVVIYASYHRETLQLIGRYCADHNKPLIWTAGCRFASYLLFAPATDIPAYLSTAIEEVDGRFENDSYYPSYVSAFAGGAAASVAINALLGKATPIFRKCNVNTLIVDYLQPNII